VAVLTFAHVSGTWGGGARLTLGLVGFFSELLARPWTASVPPSDVPLPAPVSPASVPQMAPAPPSGAPTAGAPASLAGFVPRGRSLWVVVGGGTLEDVRRLMSQQGAATEQCTLGSLVGGRWVLHIAGAPASVNAAWLAQYPERLPDGLALWSRCPD
jgi:hypothetical protein